MPKNNKSIVTPNTKYLYPLTAIIEPYTKNTLPSTPHSFEALISDKFLRDCLIDSHCNKQNILLLDEIDIIGINMSDMYEKLFEILKQYESGNIDTKQSIKDIDEYIQTIKNTVNNFKTRYANLFKEDTSNDINMYNTQQLFNKSSQKLETLLDDIGKSQNEATIMAKNQTNKMLVVLMGLNVYYSHSSIVMACAMNLLHTNSILFRIIQSCFAITPYGATISLIVLVGIALFYISSLKNNHNLKIKLYEFYAVLNSISQKINKQNTYLASIINIDKKYSGNIMLLNKKVIKYLTKPLHNHIYMLLNDSFIDKSYICTTLNKNQVIDLNIVSLLEQNSTQENHLIKPGKHQFAISIYPHIKKQNIENSDIINTSAFKHLKSIILEFSDFLFIQSPYFSSTIALDMISQSFSKSHENNNYIANKYMLFITNPISISSPHYKISEFVKTQCRSNNNIKDNVLFLNTINRINKQQLLSNFTEQIKKYYTTIPNTQNDIKNLMPLLQDLCDNHKNIMDIADNFNAINNFLLKQFNNQALDGRHTKTIQNIINILFSFENILSHFIDFKINKNSKEAKIVFEEEDLNELRNKVREKLNDIPLFQSIFCITHLFNNAYFSNTPAEQINLFKSLLKNCKEQVQFMRYKNKLENIKLSNSDIYYFVDFLLPFNSQILLAFFNKDEYDEICIFILYLLDLEIDGMLIYCRYHLIALSNYTPENNIKNFENIFKKDFQKRLQNTLEDVSIDSILDTLKGKIDNVKINQSAINIIIFLASTTIKKSKDWIKNNVSKKSLETNNLILLLQGILSNQKNITNMDNILNDTINQTNMPKQIPTPTKQIDKYKFDIINILLKQLQGIKKIQPSPQGLIAFAIMEYLDKKFPIISKADLKRQIMFFLLTAREKQDAPYSKWEANKDYFYIPKELNKTLIVGDFHASLLLDNALDCGYLTHNPSIAAYIDDEEAIRPQLINELKAHINNSVALDGIGNNIIKEAYCKILHYLDIGTNESMQFLTTRLNLSEKKIRQYFNLSTISSKELAIKTKINSKEGNKDNNFRKSTHNVKYIKDFLVQLKRIAEYNYSIYNDTINKNAIDKNNNNKTNTAPQILGNYIYNENFIPSNIDLID
ncbi:hypothetical protein [Campylobacter troglodytis]|uniref:hypothetical protein n=1 Tax=Campylobacter troglodytis TaxID=654363 RepID=UPI00115B33A8|nr:hypothetical protein [Campylobacter troglodytis]TQR56561.1 hypothetical protein DMC01_09110 [Campylobacter troglodytis]